MLLLSLAGSLLLRLAERKLTVSLFQLPPRLTRFEVFRIQPLNIDYPLNFRKYFIAITFIKE